MYESFYGLREKPFNLLPDPEYLYMSQGHEHVYTHLKYAILENKGFTVITGEIGCGKTTLINFLLKKIKQKVKVGLINNPCLPPNQFIKMLCQEFELPVDGKDKAEMLGLFHEFLLHQYAETNRVIMIVDEAQNLPPRTIEEIRILSNLESEKDHLIQIILVGQPGLKSKLQRKELVQFTQRVTVQCHLRHLDRPEVEQLIRHRLKVAGGNNQDIFTAEAIDAIFNHTQGIPRLVNILCDAALVYGYVDELRAIDKGTVENVIASREESGIFSNLCQNDNTVSELSVGANGLSGHLWEKLKLIEKRLELIENSVANMDRRFDALERKSVAKDKTVLELLKMLKENMDKRFLTLGRLYRLMQGQNGVGKSENSEKVQELPSFSPQLVEQRDKLRRER